MLHSPLVALSPISPIRETFPAIWPPQQRKTQVQSVQVQSVYDILSKSLSFTNDGKFWWDTTGRMLASMFSLLGYDVHVQYFHMLFFHLRVRPYMGPRPNWQNQAEFKSYMTDDHTPIEVSWIVNPDGTATVRYAIEPIDLNSDNSKAAALQMVEELKPAIRNLNLEWFDILNDALVWHGNSNIAGAKHATQYFLGFDCAHTGNVTLKAYFLPEIKSVKTRVSKDELVSRALVALDHGLETPWKATVDYFDTLPSSIRPSVEIIATDCAAPKDSRIKVYVRTRSTKFSDLEGLMTLGGKLKGKVIEDAMSNLTSLWEMIMRVDTSAPDWKEQRLTPRLSVEANDNHITGGLLLYYELKPGCPLPFPKVYLPVRHYCSDDLAIAEGMEAYHRKKGGVFVDGYIRDVESIFGRHRSLSARTGIHTYVSLAIKKSDFEVTSYFNPEAYAPERFL
ncbi:hypothetical protein SERLA73DRAFT_187119 [Serpula lacrymans var. lacrymans S7.3]|uniref:Uncharacterized protein n=2 Tax=Serpula lacrymans var. lacrymans TaxID=341189 RepID=F8Q8I4_SERL3|nr:tryptophan dimethylallyl transferase variant 1 [Serpula lacrymans var. lacrymans S7.9]XP_007322389.1 tryptophan dimethylallyl transferase variant 2 [Serpula lacrymans var. lacrymans S7.9]EGN95872.1 hypothetical protein SERLA73DRAFT_187119 [Serpula lacrymans var. lacrymans S7.3]EGO21431.1 tryptophan dimethylallyl transferase variant 1 [Serpula lacrymans var. lacrymans S7.9]EGO21432.1 tryptophan dimethylallyl transferase variant 2 [Serpula lacrymans var. lacrymans S7.9]